MTGRKLYIDVGEAEAAAAARLAKARDPRDDRILDLEGEVRRLKRELARRPEAPSLEGPSPELPEAPSLECTI